MKYQKAIITVIPLIAIILVLSIDTMVLEAWASAFPWGASIPIIANCPHNPQNSRVGPCTFKGHDFSILTAQDRFNTTLYLNTTMVVPVNTTMVPPAQSIGSGNDVVELMCIPRNLEIYACSVLGIIQIDPESKDQLRMISNSVGQGNLTTPQLPFNSTTLGPVDNTTTIR